MAFQQAIQDVETETLAFEQLSDLYETDIPRFYGLFDFSLPVPGSDQHRVVYVILIDFVPGTPLSRCAPDGFTELQRKAIMKRVVEIFVNMCLCGVVQDDYEPRNLMIAAGETSIDTPKVIAIDLAFAIRVQQSIDVFGESHHPIYRWRESQPLSYRIRRWAAIGAHPLNLTCRGGRSPIEVAAGVSVQGRQKYAKFEAARITDFDNPPPVRLWVSWDWTSWLEETFKDSEKYGKVTEKQMREWRSEPRMYDPNDSDY